MIITNPYFILLKKIKILQSWLYALYLKAFFPVFRMTGLRISYGTIFSINNVANFFVGNNVTISSGVTSNPISNGGYSYISTLKSDARLTIHEGCAMSNVKLVCSCNIEIGARTLIGDGVQIYDTDFHSKNLYNSGFGDFVSAKSAPIFIGSDCFIGTGVLILKGSHIPDKTVVPARAVVTSRGVLLPKLR